MKTRAYIYFVKTSLSILAFVILAGGIAHFFVLEPTRVKGQSMESTFLDTQSVMIEKVSLLFIPPRRGQVVSAFDEVSDVLLVKRIIGLPGEQVILKSDGIYIIDKEGRESKLNEPYLDQGTVTRPQAGREAIYPIIEKNEYFVMGDNRGLSADSRTFGTIHRSKIVGVIRQIPFFR
jgi:signal peptidase I